MLSTQEREQVIREKIFLITAAPFDIDLTEHFMSFAGRTFKLMVSVTDEDIDFEAYLWLSRPVNEELREELKKINEDESFLRDGKRWIRFAITAKPEHLMIAAMIPVDKEKEKSEHHAFFHYDPEFEKIFQAIVKNREVIEKA